jgi:hypothetical protein
VPITQLTDPDAVLRAIRDFDDRGRDDFLGHHGFGPARFYFLVHERKLYDSKAIAGVAYGYQYPERGVMRAAEFTGGGPVVRTLEKLGFEVTSDGQPRREPQVWAFCANPNRYRIQEALSELQIDWWSVPRGDVRAGDKAIIWQTLDSRGRRGVVGIAEVTGDPEERADGQNPYWVDAADAQVVGLRVPVRYLEVDRLPLWLGDSRAAFLSEFSVARARGGTVFHVTDGQWDQLQAVVGLEAVSPEALEAERLLRHGTRTRGGQGFGLSAEERSAVETFAMAQAERYLEGSWDDVDDVSDRSSFDLLCTRGSDKLRVEVKGTTSPGEQIILTRNEVLQARESGYALFVVSDITLKRDGSGPPVASGGTCRYFEPWSPGEGTLQPIAYKCQVAPDDGEVVFPA